MWSELSRVKLYSKWPEGKWKLLRVSGRFELSRVLVTEGKITVNVWKKSMGNWCWFELARGFELSGFDYNLQILRKEPNRKRKLMLATNTKLLFHRNGKQEKKFLDRTFFRYVCCVLFSSVVVVWDLFFIFFPEALTSECRTLKSVSILHSPFLSDAAFKCLATCRRLHKIRIEGKLSSVLFVSFLFTTYFAFMQIGLLWVWGFSRSQFV